MFCNKFFREIEVKVTPRTRKVLGIFYNITEHTQKDILQNMFCDISSSKPHGFEFSVFPSHLLRVGVQGGEDPQDALSCRSFSAKEPLIIGLFCTDLSHLDSTSRCYLRIFCYAFMIQGGEDLQDALSCRSFSAKEPLIIGLFCGK